MVNGIFPDPPAGKFCRVSPAKGAFCRARSAPCNFLNASDYTLIFCDWHGLCNEAARAAAWESWRHARRPDRLGRATRSIARGDYRWRTPFSSDCRARWRCERELDVIANNIANLNTTGFKADSAVFEEFLMPVARDERLSRRRPPSDFVQDRATWLDIAGPVQQTGNPLDVAINGNAFLAVQTAARRALHPQRRAADQRQGQLVTIEGDKVLGDNGPIVFQTTDHEIIINPTARSRCAKAQRHNPTRARQAAPRQLRQSAAPAEGRHHRPSRRPPACAAARRTRRPRHPGRDREIERAKASSR